MGHHCTYYPRIEFDRNNKLQVIVKAVYKEKSEDVYTVDEFGKSKNRYLYYSQASGYIVVFPNEKLGYYYGRNYIQEEEELEECNNCNLYAILTPEQIQKVSEVREDLKYLCSKIKDSLSIHKFINLIQMYKKHKEVEVLASVGLYEVALNGNFWRFTDKKKKEYTDFIRKYLEDIIYIKQKHLWGDINLRKIKDLMELEKQIPNDRNYILGTSTKKLLIAYQMYLHNLDFTEWNYCYKKNVEIQDYITYKSRIKSIKVDYKDDYWRFPNNFEKKNDQVKSYIENINKSQELISRIITNQKLSCFKELYKKTKRIYGNYELYIPYTLNDIEEQAEELNQCLIRNDYVEKVLSLNSILIFIKDNSTNKRIATAQIDYTKKILQFYAYEYLGEREKSIPTQEVQDLLNKYLQDIKLFKPKVELKTHVDGFYYKGVTEEETDMFKKTKYEVGKIYDTHISNEQFNEQCKSSAMAIHFCKDITKVSQFINAKKILIIKALGKVCNVGDEYFSNKIQIVGAF